MEGNLCFNCVHIAHFHPTIRPKRFCNCFYPLGTKVSQKKISEWLGVSLGKIEYILYTFGADKLVEMLKIRGHIVRYERKGVKQKNIYFYDVNAILKEVKELK